MSDKTSIYTTQWWTEPSMEMPPKGKEVLLLSKTLGFLVALTSDDGERYYTDPHSISVKDDVIAYSILPTEEGLGAWFE